MQEFSDEAIKVEPIEVKTIKYIPVKKKETIDSYPMPVLPNE